MTAANWQDFEATMKPNTDQMRMLGHYAVDTRRRGKRKSQTPASTGAGSRADE
jgi:hypothetical protein